MKTDAQGLRKPYACGRTHEIVADDMIIEEGIIQCPPHIMKTYYSEYKTIAMLCDDNTYATAGKFVKKLLPGVITIKLNPENLHADEHDVEATQRHLDKYAGVDFLITADSGVAHNIIRYYAYGKKLPFLNIPTAANMDGYASTVTTMTQHGSKKSFTVVSPRFVLTDNETSSEAPLRLTASGVADLLGKFTALCDWRTGHVVTDEYICDAVVDMEYKVLKELCEDLYGIHNRDLNAYENLMYGLLLSSMAMQMVGDSRPASGAEHHMSYLWEMSIINKLIGFYHGERVSVGPCVATAVYKKAEQKLRAEDYQVKDHMELETEFIKANITSPVLQEKILKENTLNLITGITGDMLKEKEADILTILVDLPDVQTMVGWVKKVHGLAAMQELTPNEALRMTTQRLGSHVRQQLTFMRLLKFYDFCDEITEEWGPSCWKNQSGVRWR